MLRRREPSLTQTEDVTNTPPAPTIWPALRCKDAKGLIKFLVDAFGFEETLVVEDAKSRGAEVLQGLKDEDYGSRGFTVKDPEGNVWTLGTYRGA